MRLLPDDVVAQLEKELKKNPNYILVTLLDGEYKITPRYHQPCLGGNHRKYKQSHPDDCTRPNDPCPGDLSNHKGNCKHLSAEQQKNPPNRFPDGAPSGSAYPFGFNAAQVPYVKYVTSAESPWIKGFGAPEAVHFFPNGDGIKGFVLKTGEVDPTVMMNWLKNLQSACRFAPLWEKARASGMSDKEALVCAVFLSTLSNTKYDPKTRTVMPCKGTFLGADNYTMDARVTIPRFINQNPRDVTGGLWVDRFDYNRPDVHKIFREGTPDEQPLNIRVNAEIQKSGEDPYVVAKRIIQQEMNA